MIEALTKLATLLNRRGHTKTANQVCAIIKTAYTLDFYHGTSTKFLHSILKTGLSPAPKSKYGRKIMEEIKGRQDLNHIPVHTSAITL